MKHRSLPRAAAVLVAVLASAALGACDAPTSSAPEKQSVLNSFPGATDYSVTESGGYPLVSWNPSPGATGYTVELIVFRTLNGVYQEHSFHAVGSTTGTSLLDTEHPYTGAYECSYPGWRGEDQNTYGYWFEYAISVHYPGGTSERARYFAPIAEPNCVGWYTGN